MKLPAKLSSETSIASSIESIAKKSNNPAVNAKKKWNFCLLIFLIKGSHNNPIITGIIPTYVPIIAKKIAGSKEGYNAGAAASTSFSNLVPSSIVIPMV